MSSRFDELSGKDMERAHLGVTVARLNRQYAAEAAVEAVLAIHEPGNYSDGNNYCILCSNSGVLYPYPCPTVTAIQSALGETDANN